MRTPRRRQPLQHVLVAGTVADLLEVSTVLAVLPAGTYGQVLVEAPDDAELPVLDVPRRVTVQRVASLSRAVTVWVGEWMPTEPDEARHVGVYLGTHARATLEQGCVALDDVADRL